MCNGIILRSTHLIEENGAVLACSSHELINTARVELHVWSHIVDFSCKHKQ